MTDDRIPPQALEMEQAVLGSMLTETAAVVVAVDMLEPQMFYRKEHGWLFGAMRAMHRDDEPIDLITLQEKLKTKRKLEPCGGVAYLLQLTDAVASAANIAYYAQQVVDAYRRRELLGASAAIRELAHSEDPTEQVLTRALKVVTDATYGVRNGHRDIGELASCLWATITDRVEHQGSLGGVASGIQFLDDLTDGWKPGEFTIVGSRPSCGKTALGTQLAWFPAMRGTPTAFVSAEMSPDMILARIASQRTGINLRAMMRGTVSDCELKAVSDCIGHVAEWPLTLIDGIGKTVEGVAHSLLRVRGLKLAVIDYVQRLRPCGGENRTQEVSRLARDLKTMAARLECPVVAMAQLNRTPTDKASQRPCLSDLRESGDLEAEADNVLLLWRPKGEFETACDDAPECSQRGADLAKQRNGPTGLLSLRFRTTCARWEDDR